MCHKVFQDSWLVANAKSIWHCSASGPILYSPNCPATLVMLSYSSVEQRSVVKSPSTRFVSDSSSRNLCPWYELLRRGIVAGEKLSSLLVFVRRVSSFMELHRRLGPFVSVFFVSLSKWLVSGSWRYCFCNEIFLGCGFVALLEILLLLKLQSAFETWTVILTLLCAQSWQGEELTTQVEFKWHAISSFSASTKH